jgi:broad specificity phosphatase PhoE
MDQDRETTEITRWWWVRHAPVIGHEGRVYGASDVPADVTDGDGFRALAARLPADAVWVTSHLSRARDTAQAIAAAGLESGEATIESDLAEQNFGAWQGRTYAELEADLRVVENHKFWIAPARHRPPGGESFIDVFHRVRAVIDRLTAEHGGRDIIAVAHGGSIRAALAHALGLDPDRALGFSTENLSTTRIDHLSGSGLGGNWRVAFVNLRP